MKQTPELLNILEPDAQMPAWAGYLSQREKAKTGQLDQQTQG